MSEVPPVAAVFEQEIDLDVFEQLLFDIEHAGELLGVVVKGAASRYTSGGRTDLGTAREALANGAVGVQLRYRHEGLEWWDTILRSVDGQLRIVRTQPPLS